MPHRSAPRRALDLLTYGVVTFIAFASSLAQQPQVHRGPIPDSKFYSLVFRHVLYLQAHGEQPTISGGISPSIARFYSAKVGANPTELGVLLSEAMLWKTEVDPVDNQAHAIIEGIHAKTPGGRLARDEQPPAVPQQLIDLQTKRDNITLKHVATLKGRFGAARFATLDNGIHRSAHLSMKTPLIIASSNAPEAK